MAEITASKDSFIWWWWPDSNNGAGEDIMAEGESDGDLPARGLIAFDISGIGRVASAILQVYLRQCPGASGPTKVQRMLVTDWVENQVTYNLRKTGTAWNTAGCSGSGTDFTPTNEATSNTPAAPGWQSWDITDLFNDAVDNGQDILSVRLTDAGFTDGAAYFASKERSSGAYAPKVVYNEASKSRGGMLFWRASWPRSLRQKTHI